MKRSALRAQFDRIDQLLTGWMAANAITLLRVSGLGLVFFWFGALKLFPGLSPAESFVAGDGGPLCFPSTSSCRCSPPGKWRSASVLSPAGGYV